MPIVQTYPPVDEAKRRGVPVFVDSTAENNVDAIREVEDWCRQNGLVRARENHLRTLRTAAGVVRRGICYEPPVAETEQRRAEWNDMERRRQAMPETTPDDAASEES
ncbi:MAG TPA: hypothetical protein QGH10_19205 [Armatimonadota bacterium]|nr:hypothetical protein [Armatimonadota bacterium]